MMRNSEFLSASHDLGSLAEGLRMPALGARVDRVHSQSARSTNTESGSPHLHHHNVEVIASLQDIRERFQEAFLLHRV